MGFMNGKRVLIVGVASKLSIAYGIAEIAKLKPCLVNYPNIGTV